VVAVDEREVEAPALGHEARQGDLRLLLVELDELRDARFLEELEPAAGEPRRLVRVDRDVSRLRGAVLEQAGEDVERRDAVAEADLDRPPRALAPDPRLQGRALGSADRDGKEAVHGAVRAGDRSPFGQQAREHGAGIHTSSVPLRAEQAADERAPACVERKCD
jgi:hypothetical protein